MSQRAPGAEGWVCRRRALVTAAPVWVEAGLGLREEGGRDVETVGLDQAFRGAQGEL